MQEDKKLNVSGIRDVYKIILNYLLQFRQTAVSVEDADELLVSIELSRLDISPQLYASLIDLYSSFLQILPLYSLWLKITAEERGQVCLTWERVVESFLDFVGAGPAYLSTSVSEEKRSIFMQAFSEQYNASLQYVGNPDMSSWLSFTDRLYQFGADRLYDIIAHYDNGG